MLCACPHCQGELITTVERYQDDATDDSYINEKYENLVKKFGRARIDDVFQTFGWSYENDDEMKRVIFGRTIYEGEMRCKDCKEVFPIRNRLGRFVREGR